MILWIIAVVGFCVLVQLVRSRDQFLDGRRPGDRFGLAAIAILIVGGLAYDSTLVGGSRWLQVVIVAGVLAATVGRMAAVGRSTPARHSLLAFVPMLLAFYMFVLSGFNATDTSFFGRLAPVILWGCLGVLLISGAIRVRALLLVIVCTSCCVGIVLPFMGGAFVPCTEFKCGPFQELLAGPFSSGNYLAQLASLALLVGAFCFTGTLRVSVIAVNALVLIATDSRTSQVAVLLGLLFGWLALTISVTLRRRIPTGTVTFLAWSAAIAAAAVGCYTIYNLTDGDFSDRSNIWARGVRVLGDRWLTGLGGEAWSSYQANGALPPLFPHSQYLMMLFWGGVAGVVGYVVILASTLSRAGETELLPFTASIVFFMLALGMTEAYWNPAAVDGHSFFILLILAIAYQGAELAISVPTDDSPPPAPARRGRARFDPPPATPAEEQVT